MLMFNQSLCVDGLFKKFFSKHDSGINLELCLIHYILRKKKLTLKGKRYFKMKLGICK